MVSYLNLTSTDAIPKNPVGPHATQWLSEMGDDPLQDGVLEGGASETNLLQLPCFIMLNLSGTVRGSVRFTDSLPLDVQCA